MKQEDAAIVDGAIDDKSKKENELMK